MASIHLQGTLVDTLGEIDVGAIMTWTHLTATGETIPTTKVDLMGFTLSMLSTVKLELITQQGLQKDL